MLFFHYQHSFFCGVLLIQLIPARGRLHRWATPGTLLDGYSLSPRGDGYLVVIVDIPIRELIQLIPARGRLRSTSPRLKKTPRIQLIPARGRLQIKPGNPRRKEDTAYPREGTVTAIHAQDVLRNVDTAYPREGTVTILPRTRCLWMVIQLIPARGRLPRARKTRQKRRRYSLSPRGDGYEFGVASTDTASDDTAYPREGTVTTGESPLRRADSDTAYPREGTVTDLCAKYRFSGAGYSLSPRGDGYRRHNAVRHNQRDTAYPREGTVTCNSWGSSILPGIQLIPARGRLQCRLADFQAVSNDTAYPREGTVTSFRCST